MLPPEGGFARLLREGTYAKDVRFAHAFCATAAGHATLFSGAVPRASGVTQNGYIDPESGQFISVLADPGARLVTASGPTDKPSSSIRVLEVETVADRLRAEHPGATIISLSIKDRGAIFGGGRAPTATLWFDAGVDGAVTSTAFGAEVPAWARDASAPRPADLRKTPWSEADPAWLSKTPASPDDAAGEGDWYGLGKVYPHDVAHAGDPAKAFRATPYADDWVLALARGALDAPREPGPVLLVLSLSATDYIGHVFGPMSREALDGLFYLDRALATFFADLDRRFGAEGYSVVLGSDHGVGPMPEWPASGEGGPCDALSEPDRARCAKSERILEDPLVPKLEKAAERAVGSGRWVLGISEPYIVLTDAGRALPPEPRARLKKALAEVMKAEPAIRDVFDTDALPETCPADTDESIAALVCRSVWKGRGGDLYVVPHAGSFFDVGYTPGEGANHGTPYLYDRSVPVIARAPGKVAASLRIDEPVGAEVFARTLSDLLGVGVPEHARDGRSLVER